MKRWLLHIAQVLGSTLALVTAAFLVSWWRVPPIVDDGSQTATSLRIEDREGQALLRQVGADDQWREPISLDAMGAHLPAAVMAVEDERFLTHLGVDPIATTRAVFQNLRHAEVISGASTLTMQVCKMLDPAPRTLRSKWIEAIRALKYERNHQKDEVLELWLNIAPFGSNLRGVRAASLHWFGVEPANLHLAEAALLAGLPQSPERLRPDRNPEAALKRRNHVLDRMLIEHWINEQAHADAIRQPIRLFEHPRNEAVPDAVGFLAAQQRPRGGTTTIDPELQEKTKALIHEHLPRLPEGTDVAAVIIETATNSLVALVGSANRGDPQDGWVNGATALRSPGSALKPFLYGTAYESGRLSPESEIPDRRINREGWTPNNYHRTFNGLVTAREALQRSLNVPAILVTEAVGVSKNVAALRKLGLTLPENAAERGGLALAVGGLEVSLLDLTNAYATLARSGVHAPVHMFKDDLERQEHLVFSPETCAHLNHDLASWRHAPAGMDELPPRDRPWFMWKSGTSSGHRDAWALGHNGEFAIGFWVGHFHGEGDPAFVGREAAGPLLADAFTRLVPATASPPIPEPLVVERPYSFDEDLSDHVGPRIITPAEDLVMECQGAYHQAVHGEGEGLHWFLNGKRFELEGEHVRLEPGSHRLVLVDQQGRRDVRRIVVQQARRSVTR
ncbi:MAG: penicillin-binding protein 1C [Planctomycetota bacterium]|nr:penicillin-binding protein 1C [Planctomycetota bacterium]